MKKFVVGGAYTMRSPYENLFLVYKVTARTKRTVTLNSGDEIIKCKLAKRDVCKFLESEAVYPLANHQMFATLTAKEELA